MTDVELGSIGATFGALVAIAVVFLRRRLRESEGAVAVATPKRKVKPAAFAHEPDVERGDKTNGGLWSLMSPRGKSGAYSPGSESQDDGRRIALRLRCLAPALAARSLEHDVTKADIAAVMLELGSGDAANILMHIAPAKREDILGELPEELSLELRSLLLTLEDAAEDSDVAPTPSVVRTIAAEEMKEEKEDGNPELMTASLDVGEEHEPTGAGHDGAAFTAADEAAVRHLLSRGYDLGRIEDIVAPPEAKKHLDAPTIAGIGTGPKMSEFGIVGRRSLPALDGTPTTQIEAVNPHASDVASPNFLGERTVARRAPRRGGPAADVTHRGWVTDADDLQH